ncbi:MAG: hypothetical protein GY928_18215 [Colwellia sp.]|nr:hypothetical protein [Colwellia sp.]
MKKWQVEHLVFSIIAILTVTYLTFGGEASWSQNAMTPVWFMLNIALIAIAKTFSTLANNHPSKELSIYKWLGVDIRLKNLARFTEYSFYAILIFHLDSEILPEWMHMVATGLGVTGLYLMAVGWYRTGTALWLIFVTLISLAALSLVLAFMFHTWNVGYGEYALALVGLGFQFMINRENNG